MSKQSAAKRGKVVQFPGTQPFMYKGREVHLTIGIWPDAKGNKTFKYEEDTDAYWLFISAVNLEQGWNRISQYADELGICLEGGTS